MQPKPAAFESWLEVRPLNQNKKVLRVYLKSKNFTMSVYTCGVIDCMST